jgi:glycosyltransferase involved in cell wall biosynthesis
MMIKAFREVKNQMPGFKLVLIGDGEKMQELKQLTRSLDIEDHVIFTGFINNPQRFICLFDLFLLSSFSEGTSMTLLEAMSLGIPCVVTDVGGNPEVVENNSTGYVVPSDNDLLFSKSILDLLQNNTKRNEFAIKSRYRYLRKFTVEKMVSSYQNIYI